MMAMTAGDDLQVVCMAAPPACDPPLAGSTPASGGLIKRADRRRQHDQGHQQREPGVANAVAGVSLGLGCYLPMEGDEDQAEGVDRGQEGTARPA